jgi:DNA-binding NarL/FixJ family response regulator
MKESLQSASLTPHQLRIARLVAEGFSNKQIAEALPFPPGKARSVQVVKNTLSFMFARAHVRNRAELAAAYASGKLENHQER